jgi:hypothetical protein
MDKPSCYRLAEGAGLRTPRVFVPGDAAELDAAVCALDLDAQRYILSVRLPGDVPADPATGRMTTVAGEDAEVVRARCLAIAARTGELPMIVEVVPGRSDRCVGVSMVVGRDQVPVVAYCVRRLQLRLYASDSRFVHPYELGANVYCESVHDDEAIEAATRFVRAARFYGAITVEFRRGRARREAHVDQGGPASGARDQPVHRARPRRALRALRRLHRRPSTRRHSLLPGASGLDVARLVLAHRWPESGPGLAHPPVLGCRQERAPHPRVRVPERP